MQIVIDGGLTMGGVEQRRVEVERQRDLPGAGKIMDLQIDAAAAETRPVPAGIDGQAAKGGQGDLHVVERGVVHPAAGVTCRIGEVPHGTDRLALDLSVQRGERLALIDGNEERILLHHQSDRLREFTAPVPPRNADGDRVLATQSMQIRQECAGHDAEHRQVARHEADASPVGEPPQRLRELEAEVELEAGATQSVLGSEDPTVVE